MEIEICMDFYETRRLPKNYFPHYNIAETIFFRTKEIPNVKF